MNIDYNSYHASLGRIISRLTWRLKNPDGTEGQVKPLLLTSSRWYLYEQLVEILGGEEIVAEMQKATILIYLMANVPATWEQVWEVDGKEMPPLQTDPTGLFLPEVRRWSDSHIDAILDRTEALSVYQTARRSWELLPLSVADPSQPSDDTEAEKKTVSRPGFISSSPPFEM